MTALLKLKSPTQVDTAFLTDVLAGLNATPKRLPAKYFYDEAGSRLFERITTLLEYYPTRTELKILADHAADIAGLFPKPTALVEFGSGSSVKTRIVLQSAKHIAAYVPVDICTEFLEREAARLRREFPRLAVLPVHADFAGPFELPAAVGGLRRVGFFPGSTIGNFEPHEAAAFLARAARVLGDDGAFIIGVDLIKDAKILNAAYNDAAGVTAKFNLNLLARINREIGADFHLGAFEHHAFYNRELGRIEMHLASLKRQKVRVDGETVAFRAGETIHTENSYKYTVESFGALARGCGWTPVQVWTDADQFFSVQVLVREKKRNHRRRNGANRRSS